MAAGFIARQTYTEEASTDTPAPREEPIPKREFEGHKDTIWSFVFLHDNVHIVSGSEDGTMRKWNCDTGLAVGEPWKGSGARGGVYALALSPDGKRIACGRWDGGVQRWNTDSGKMIGAVWRGHSNAVVSLSWSPGGRRIASGSDAGTILLRSAKNGKTDVGPIKTKQDWVESLAYSPLGDRIASGGRNSTICIWNTQTGKLVIDPIKGLGWSVTSIVWSLDSSKLYSTSDTSARVFDSTSGALLHRFEHGKHLYSVALSPSHNVLACVGAQGIIQLWDTESYQLLHEPFRQSRHALRSVLFSQNGKYLAHGGDNGVLTLWMVKDIAAQFSVPMPGRATPRQLLPVPESQSSSRLDVDDTEGDDTEGDGTESDDTEGDDTEGDGIDEEMRNESSDNSFQGRQPSLPLVQSVPNVMSPARRFWTWLFSRRRKPANESISHPKRGFLARLAQKRSIHARAKDSTSSQTVSG